jgi:hypothetical protein
VVKALKGVLQTAESWPAEAQQQLAQIAREIDAAVKRERYVASEEELRLIDEARDAVRRGDVVSEQEGPRKEVCSPHERNETRMARCLLTSSFGFLLSLEIHIGCEDSVNQSRSSRSRSS